MTCPLCGGDVPGLRSVAINVDILIGGFKSPVARGVGFLVEVCFACASNAAVAPLVALAARPG